MIIGIWILAIICLTVILGEIKYRYFDKKEIERERKSFDRRWTESIDVDMSELTMESTDKSFVPSQTLAMRGSWRLAQNQVMGEDTFRQLRAEEYRKRL